MQEVHPFSNVTDHPVPLSPRYINLGFLLVQQREETAPRGELRHNQHVALVDTRPHKLHNIRVSDFNQGGDLPLEFAG